MACGWHGPRAWPQHPTLLISSDSGQMQKPEQSVSPRVKLELAGWVGSVTDRKATT